MFHWINPISTPTRLRPSHARTEHFEVPHDGAAPQRHWLLSIRSVSEWPLACRSGAQTIDFKEPRRGPLAPTDPELWQWAASQRNCPAWLSAALGEPADALEIAGRVPPEFRFAKVGPSGCDTREKLTQMWAQVNQQLPASVELVAVAYADAKEARCPEVEELLTIACQSGFKRVLIDTFSKDGRSTLDHLGSERLAAISRWANEHQVWWALAGAMDFAALAALSGQSITPNCVGVRGSVCSGSRIGRLDEQKIRRWNLAFHHFTP